MAPPSNVIVPNSHLNSGPNNTIDEKKQKRMISNKEYSRSYRLRKRQRLDELRAKVANLSAENNMLLTRLNFLSQNYMKLHEENILLKSHALKLQKNDTHRPQASCLTLNLLICFKQEIIYGWRLQRNIYR